jgi:serine/threonine protein kinase
MVYFSIDKGAKHLITRLITVDPKKRCTLAEALRHPWVNVGFNEIPFNFIPERHEITDYELLSKEIIGRLEIFGYSKAAIKKAFSKFQDYTKPNAVRSTYFLLAEMVQREQIKLREQRAEQFKEDVLSSLGTLNSGSSSTIKLQKQNCQNGYFHASSNTISSMHGSALLNPQNSIGKRVPTTRAISYSQDVTRNEQSDLIEPIASISLKDPHIEDRWKTNIRRQSVPLLMEHLNTHQKQQPSTSEKFKEELRSVSGWFLNFSTTTSKSPNDILLQLQRIIGPENLNLYSYDQKFVVGCEVDINNPAWNKNSSSRKSQIISFHVEICKVPRMDLNAIHFKRIAGGVWNYKKVCNRVLSQMSL